MENKSFEQKLEEYKKSLLENVSIEELLDDNTRLRLECENLEKSVKSWSNRFYDLEYEFKNALNQDEGQLKVDKCGGDYNYEGGLRWRNSWPPARYRHSLYTFIKEIFYFQNHNYFSLFLSERPIEVVELSTYKRFSILDSCSHDDLREGVKRIYNVFDIFYLLLPLILDEEDYGYEKWNKRKRYFIERFSFYSPYPDSKDYKKISENYVPLLTIESGENIKKTLNKQIQELNKMNNDYKNEISHLNYENSTFRKENKQISTLKHEKWELQREKENQKIKIESLEKILESKKLEDQNIQNARNLSDYKEWREIVLKRDKSTCQVCGETRKPHAHHIFSYKNNPSLRLNPENGIVLCKYCHEKYHDLYGTRNKVNPNTLLKFIEAEKD